MTTPNLNTGLPILPMLSLEDSVPGAITLNYNGLTGTQHGVKSPTAQDNFSNELNKLQELQIVTAKNLLKERKRKEQLDLLLKMARFDLRGIQDKTNNGNLAKDLDIRNKKMLARLEYELQNSKTKLSVARNENSHIKKKIHDLRLEKCLNLQILNDLSKESEEMKLRCKQCQKDILALNERKNKTKLGITNVKHKMVRDIEDFSRELSNTKQNISNTQQSILGTIREKIHSAYNADDFGGNLADSNVQNIEFDHASGAAHNRLSEIENMLKDTEFSKVEELICALQQSEEQVFSLYSETQTKHEEMEKLDLENKYLEKQVETQITRLNALEGHNDEVRLELENNILVLKRNISKYEEEYTQNLEVLSSISASMLNLLKTVAIDEVALDQQLISTGINDRNIDDFLGLIEQRIDDLIQMSKASQHQAIKRDDFMKIMTTEKYGAFQMPVLPSLQDGFDDDDEIDDAVKLQPINIGVLKELMQKKVQKISGPTSKPLRGMLLGGSHSSSKQRISRASSSNLSIKSSNSNG